MTLTQIKGLAWALLSVFFWGTMFPVGRFLIGGQRIDPVSLGILRFAVGGTALFLTGLLLYRKKMFDLTRAEWCRLPFQGLVGASMMALLLFLAQKEIPVINASMLEAIVPLQIFVISLCLGKGDRWCSLRDSFSDFSAVCWCCGSSTETELLSKR